MIYVCSDIHGQYGLFKRMLSTIKFSDDDTLYIIGDIIDRGPNSIKLLQFIMQHDNMIALLGNHELMMYNHFFGLERNDPWTIPNNGGKKTLEEFKQLDKKQQQLIFDYIHNMLLQKELKIKDKTFLLSHSSFINGTFGSKIDQVDCDDIYWKDVSYWTANDVVWFSPWRTWEYTPLDSYKKDNKIHIIGHVPTLRVDSEDWGDTVPDQPCAFDRQNVINIDLGCAYMSLPKNKRPHGVALCCMNLDKYAEGQPDAFYYIK